MGGLKNAKFKMRRWPASGCGAFLAGDCARDTRPPPPVCGFFLSNLRLSRFKIIFRPKHTQKLDYELGRSIGKRQYHRRTRKTPLDRRRPVARQFGVEIVGKHYRESNPKPPADLRFAAAPPALGASELKCKGTMTLRQQLVADRIANLVTSIGIPQDQAFERFVHSLVTGKSVHSLDPADWVDGSQDKQIDLISIEEEDDEAEIFIISAKFTDGFSSNAIILMRNGLGWMLNRPRTEIATITNEAFRDKILEVRSVLSGIGPSNVKVRCYFSTNGLVSSLSNEYQQEVRGILSEYDNGTFAEFTFETLGADGLVGLINRIEKRNRSIDADVPIRYDANTPSLIRYQTQGLPGRSYFELVNHNQSAGAMGGCLDGVAASN